MSYNAKNYTEQGGEKTVIGGTLSFTDDAVVENFPGGGGYTLPAATEATLGGVKVGDGLSAEADGTLSVSAATKTVAGGVLAVDNLEDCAATDVAGVNAFINTYLLARLRQAGILKD